MSSFPICTCVSFVPTVVFVLKMPHFPMFVCVVLLLLVNMRVSSAGGGYLFYFTVQKETNSMFYIKNRKESV